jgi:hypothetical protein
VSSIAYGHLLRNCRYNAKALESLAAAEICQAIARCYGKPDLSKVDMHDPRDIFAHFIDALLKTRALSFNGQCDVLNLLPP